MGGMFTEALSGDHMANPMGSIRTGVLTLCHTVYSTQEMPKGLSSASQ